MAVFQLSDEEERLISRHLVFYQNLASGSLRPSTPEQEHFVLVCQGKAVAETPHERAYIKFRRISNQEHKLRLREQSAGESIPEHEEGSPSPDFFTREDAVKLRRREYGAMRKRHQEG